MWQTAALASAGGGVVTFVVWQLILGLQRRMAAGRLSLRLRQIRGHTAVAAKAPASARETRYSHLPVLRWIVGRLAIAPRILLLLEQAGSSLNVSSYVMLHLCCGLGGVLVVRWFRVPMLPAVVIVLAAALAPLLVMNSKRRSRLSRLSEQLPDAIRLIASALRAGLGLDAGLNIVASELPDPIRSEFRKLLNEALLEADVGEAFRRLEQRVPIADFRLFAASARLHREIGGNFTELLDRLEETVRTRFQLFRELKTLTAESRLTGWILGALPVGVSLAIFGLRPDYLRLLLESQTGQTMLWAAIGLQLAGFGIIWWLVHPRIH